VRRLYFSPSSLPVVCRYSGTARTLGTMPIALVVAS
jgi:hypothetical protein